MTAIMEWLKGSALVAVTVLCLTVAYTVNTIGKHASQTLMTVDDAVVKVNTTLDKVNGKNGTVEQLNTALNDVRRIVAHSDRLLTKQEQSVDKWNSQIGDTLTNLNETLISVKTTSDVTAASEVRVTAATTQAIQGVQPVLSNAVELEKAANVTLVESTKTTQATTELILSLKATAVDLQDEVHKLTHPTKKKLGFWGTIYAGAQIVHKLSPPLF